MNWTVIWFDKCSTGEKPFKSKKEAKEWVQHLLAVSKIPRENITLLHLTN